MNEAKEYTATWDKKVEVILKAVNREARSLLILGLVTYILMGAAVVWAVGDRPLAGVVVMGFFQLMVIYMATDRIYRCIKGSFLVMLAAQSDTMPVFDRLNQSAGKIEEIADRVENKIEGGVFERVEEHLKAIRERIERDTKPLENPQRRDRSAPPAGPEPLTVSLEDIDRMEDALASEEFGQGT